MAVIAGIPSPPSNPVAGIPTPVLLGIVGGGIGLVVFLMRKNSSGGGSPDPANSTLLPNTAIMLGSLQQGVLDLKGQVGQSAVDTQTIMAGNQFSLTSQISALLKQGADNLSAVLAAGDKNTAALAAAGVSQTAGLQTQFTASSDALTKLIGDNAAANTAANQSFADYVHAGFDSIFSQHNAEMAGVSTLGVQVTGLSGQVGSVAGQVSSVGSQLTGLAGIVGSLQGPTTTISKTIADWTPWNGSKFLTQDGNGVLVNDGKLYVARDWNTYAGASNTDRGRLGINWNSIQDAYAGSVGGPP